MSKQFLYFIICIVFAIHSNAQERIHLILNDITVYQNTETNTFRILNDQDTIPNLKFVAYAENSLQVINDKNESFYINDELKVVLSPEKKQLHPCGTTPPAVTMEIIEKEDYYIIEETTLILGVNRTKKKEIIDIIFKKGIKDICFLNQEKRIRFDGNFYFPDTIIIEKEDNMIGLKSDNKITYYEDINISNPSNVKVRKNDLWGFYKRFEIKYKKLSDFVYNLASFELENGQKGYIDKQGNEYLNEVANNDDI